MEWNLKASWDLAELDEPALPNIETVDGPSIFGVGVNRSKGEFSVDLKLGQVGNSGTDSSVPKWKDAGGVSKAVSSSSGSSKRARAINNGTQTVSCLVDGCNSDLSNCRDYHRRHKVCELHSKTPQVTIGGHKQRFCQQCSRFHSLEEFDEGKRSCRKRLDGHNRRRRKPQPEPLTRSGSFLSNYQGTQMLPFASTPVYPSTAVVNPGWSTGVVSSCADARLHHKQDLFLGSPPSSYKERKQIPFLQGDNATLNNQNPTLQVQAASVCHTHVRTSSLSERNKMMCDALTTPVPDSPCALSLLSSPHTHTPMAPEPHHTMSLMQPLGLSLHDNSLESVDPVLVSSGSDHCHPSLYNMGTHASQGNEQPQPLPFHWE